MKPFLFLLAAAAAYGAVDGVVTNQTTGKPQANAVVTVFRLTEAGPQVVEAAKSDAQGHFATKQAIEPGPLLLETGYQGVSYNHMLPPGTPTTNVALTVFDVTADASAAPVTQHIVILEPAGETLNVGETYFFKNDGKLTYSDPSHGTLRFAVPPTAKDGVRIMATSPGSMAVQREAEAEKTKGVYKLDFAIKPGGETRIDVSYAVPASDPQTFAGRTFYKGPPTRFVVPNGVTLAGAGVNSLGTEPRSQAAIYETREAAYEVKLAGSGSLSASNNAEEQADEGPSLRSIAPPGIEDRKLQILGLAMAVLAFGFVLLYRRGRTAAVGTKSRG